MDMDGAWEAAFGFRCLWPSKWRNIRVVLVLLVLLVQQIPMPDPIPMPKPPAVKLAGIGVGEVVACRDAKADPEIVL